MISWPGRKTRQLDQLLRFVPDTIPDDCHLCEPFFGTGAFTFSLLDTCDRGAVFAAESCLPLNYWWSWMMACPENMAEYMADLREQYASASEDRAVFDKLRDGWNERWSMNPEDCLTSAMLWVLVYQSTNNLARFNKQGFYNQTWGRGRKVPNPVQVFDGRTCDTLRHLAEAVARGCFVTDFRDCLQQMQDRCEETIVYLDPPYILETGTYRTDCWGPDQLAQLMGWVEDMECDGQWWLWTDYLSNGGTVHPYYETIRNHYRIYPLQRRKNSRPNGSSDSKEEVIIISSVVADPDDDLPEVKL